MSLPTSSSIALHGLEAPVSVTEITLLFTDLRGSSALYDRIGDLEAFYLVQQHFERLQDITDRHNGTIIKTIGDAVMAAFLNPIDAVAAALEMRAEIAALSRDEADCELVLKIGVHKGAAVAARLNERLDYFGRTVNIAARVQGLANADEICLSEDIYEAEGVRDVVDPLTVEATISQLRGVRHDLRVFRIAARMARGAAAVAACDN